MIPEARKRARVAIAASRAAMTPEEDAAITRAAEGDPDNPPLTEADFAIARRGRPPLAEPKEHTRLRLDADVLRRLKADGPGWQTRINAILRRELKLDA